jgi:hypothetical protein
LSPLPWVAPLAVFRPFEPTALERCAHSCKVEA